ncbi:Outer membrane protein assembly factor BamB [Botrimarina colliarenosi]|uniref:Outer membrane protein assembly factor BamB n=1 Tax=Botrimarina colliarenosi TaxID=2528001 RepID=A0A5C6AJ90_9BACT|nr:PQQ-binding-like beta-propeller repeat protein [Botrimarina colliarenosi]TWT99235.1 Outer membrane protein assembly factor BamB [Botrimarina colliarenosi]
MPQRFSFSPASSRRLFSPLIAALGALSVLSGQAIAADWPVWRGPHYDGASPETDLVDHWDPAGGEGSHLLWRSAALAGRSTPIVMKGKLYTLVRDQPATELEGEKVVCADAATGEVLWKHRFNVYLSDVPDTRVGWSSVVGDPETGRVYAQGVCGYFCCLDGDSGKLIWDRSLHEEFGLLSTYGGRTNFPVIHEDTVITSAVVIGWGDTPKWSLMAKPAHRFLSFDKATGELRWLSGTSLIPEDTTYSMPALVTLAGHRALVFGSGDGMAWAIQAGTGKPLWKYPLSRRGVNLPPVVGPEGRVYIGHSEENMVGNAMGALVALDGTMVGAEKPTDLSGKEIWIKYQEMIGKSGPLLVDGRVYAISDTAKMTVFDAATGKAINRRPARLGRVMRGSPVYADGKIYACSEGGTWTVWKPTKDGVEKVDEVSLNGEQVNASPIVANGRIYMTTSEALYCIGSEESVAANADSSVPAPKPAPIGDKRVTQVQIVPWDALLKPGEKQAYRVRLYNAKGQFLREAEPSRVSFGVSGPGNITKEGVYKAPTGGKADTALVLCEIDGVAAEGRIRIVPPIPWSYDFEDGAKDVPLTWVGGRVRYVMREGDGNHYLAKPTELPTRPGAPTTKLGTRSQMWMGSPELANYTVQADIQLQEGVGGESGSDGPSPDGPPTVASAIKLPSAGLINSGYTFTLFGPNQEARLYSWCTHDRRTQAAQSMELKPSVWYRLKLSVVPKPADETAIVQAKVWPRDEAEPGEWTLQFEDKAPQLQGSPGLFGDSKEAEFYVDNLTVTPNN